MTRCDICKTTEFVDKLAGMCEKDPDTYKTMRKLAEFFENNSQICDLSAAAATPLMHEKDEEVKAKALTVLGKRLMKHPERKVTANIVRKVLSEVGSDIKNPFTMGPKSSIVLQPEHVVTTFAGLKTLTSRTKEPQYKEGDVIDIHIKAILKVKGVVKKKLGDFTEADYKAEGGYTKEEYIKVWKELHHSYNENTEVWVTEYEMAK